MITNSVINPSMHYRPKRVVQREIIDLSECLNRPKSHKVYKYAPPPGIIDLSDVRFNKKIKGLNHEKI